VAKVVEGSDKWSATIRCAHPVCGIGLHRVDGCFARIEITHDDIHARKDWEGDWSFWVICPACGQKLYPKWQIGSGPFETIKKKAHT